MAMAPLHKPAAQVGQNATRALASIAERGHPAGYLAGDRAYTQAKAEDFQLPARSLGYDLVLDYKITQLGHQGSHDGMVLVDGT
jgi:glutamate synthase domain-containing protein 1